MKEIEINMVLSVPDEESSDTISDKFVEWVESRGWTCGGGVKDLTEPKE